MSLFLHALICIVIIGAYAVLLFKIMLKKPGLLFIPALLVFVSGFVIYHIGLDWEEPAKSLMSAFYSAEFFLFQDHTLDLDFGTKPQLYQNAFICSYACAALTSGVFVVELIAKRFFSKVWLCFHKQGSKSTHIFYGVNQQSAILAGDILSKGKSGVRIIFIDDKKAKNSKKESFQNAMNDSSSEEVPISKFIDSSDYVILCSKAMISEVNLSKPESLFSQIGLKRLEKLFDEKTTFYVLSSNEAENMKVVDIVSRCPQCSDATIFCHACIRQDNVFAARRNIHFVDSAMLSIQQLKRDSSLHPVNFVEIGRNASGHKEGWVKSPFNALIVGFGETGQEALKFLYEFGAFSGKKRPDGVIPQSEFKCRVVDSNIENTTFKANMTEGLVEYRKFDVTDCDFWRYIAEVIDELNYVVVALGSDEFNLKVSQMILASAKNRPADRLAVLARVLDPSNIMLTDERFHPFGSLECIWRENVISFKDIDDLAESFYKDYQESAGMAQTSWMERHREKMDALYSNHLDEFFKLNRQELQNISNCLHKPTKHILCDIDTLDRQAIADGIPSQAVDRHYVGDDPELGSILEYLSVGEHIRWQAMYEARGFVLGEKKDELARIHNCIKPYDDLTFEVQHYDWVVVKTSLLSRS